MAPPNHIYGLTGPACVGKDTVADLLVTHHGFTKLDFADALRGELCDAFGVDLTVFTERATKEHPMTCLAINRCRDPNFENALIVHHLREGKRQLLDVTVPRSPRQILQWWGTEYRRTQNARYWVMKLVGTMSFHQRTYHTRRFVISAVRFHNEADMLRSFGGQIWQIRREGIAVPATAHASESTGEQFRPDVIIDNSHDIRHLQHLVTGEFLAREGGVKSVSVEFAS